MVPNISFYVLIIGYGSQQNYYELIVIYYFKYIVHRYYIKWNNWLIIICRNWSIRAPEDLVELQLPTSSLLKWDTITSDLKMCYIYLSQWGVQVLCDQCSTCYGALLCNVNFPWRLSSVLGQANFLPDVLAHGWAA